MNRIVGGGPQARLFLDLREEHSLTYGGYSSFNAEVYPGDWSGYSPVRTQVTGEAMDRFLYEFKRINNEPVPQNELDDAHRSIVAGFALSLEQPAQVLNSWLTVQHLGLPADYWDKYPDRIAAVDAAAVQSAAKKFVDLDHLQWVCVGPQADSGGARKIRKGRRRRRERQARKLALRHSPPALCSLQRPNQ
jgi:zinc protease